MSTRGKRRRKQLDMGMEEFFTLALLLLGRPDRSVKEYWSMTYRRGRGAAFWVRETEEGKRWLALVEQHGEAKARAAKLYVHWLRWFDTPEPQRAGYIKWAEQKV